MNTSQSLVTVNRSAMARASRYEEILSRPWIYLEEFEELLGAYPDSWELVPVHAIWKNELLPLMRQPAIWESYESAINAYLKEENPFIYKKLFGRRWRYDEKSPPFFLCRSEWAEVIVDEQIEKAERKGDLLAQQYSHIEGIRWGEHDPKNFNEKLINMSRLSKRTMLELERRRREIRVEFSPKPEDIRHWIPFHCCHFVAGFARDLAKAWDGGNWQEMEGEHHSTVVDFSKRRIFDVLLSEKGDAGELIDFARFGEDALGKVIRAPIAPPTSQISCSGKKTSAPTKNPSPVLASPQA
jgi:hypothetical protein